MIQWHSKTRILQMKSCIRVSHRSLEFKPDQVREHVLVLWLVRVQVIVLTWQWSLNSFMISWANPLAGLPAGWVKGVTPDKQQVLVRQVGVKQSANHQSLQKKGCLRTHEQGFGRRHKANERETRTLFMPFVTLCTIKINCYLDTCSKYAQ